ncbi:hypothetical protein TNCV_715921, partial [Trichonephila clavipes]
YARCYWAYGSRSEPPAHTIRVSVPGKCSSSEWRESILIGGSDLEIGSGYAVPADKFQGKGNES